MAVWATLMVEAERRARDQPAIEAPPSNDAASAEPAQEAAAESCLVCWDREIETVFLGMSSIVDCRSLVVC
jgi:hypothetical protein